jgi:hypothetical protein
MLEEKLDTLTKEIVALRQAIEANGTGGAAATTTVKKTGAAMRKAAKKDKPAVQAYIKKAKCADLAELLTKPALFDKAFEFAQGIIDAPEADDDDDV